MRREETLDEVRRNFLGTDDEWARVHRLLRAVLNACGSESRYVFDDYAIAQNAATAVTRLMAEQGLRAQSPGAEGSDLGAVVDLVVYGSIARSYLEPATASEVATLAGLGEPVSYDVMAACAGMVMAVQDAVGRFAIDDSLQTAVVSTAAMSTGRLNLSIQTPEDVAIYAAGLTVGNACTATLLSRERRVVDGSVTPSGRIVSTYARTLPQHHGLCSVPLEGPFRSNAAEMFRLARYIPEACRETVRRAGWDVQEVDLWVFHQASDRSLSQIASQLGVPASRVPAIHAMYGNCESSSAALTLRHLHDTGVLQPGMKIMVGSAAAGFMLAALGVEWAG
jgi:3-oxoacyl-[acyl-carrier-protein] synthase-3